MGKDKGEGKKGGKLRSSEVTEALGRLPDCFRAKSRVLSQQAIRLSLNYSSSSYLFNHLIFYSSIFTRERNFSLAPLVPLID